MTWSKPCKSCQCLYAELGAQKIAIPNRILAIHGEFTGIDQGNATKRIIVGRGASSVRASVTATLITDARPIVVSDFSLTLRAAKNPERPQSRASALSQLGRRGRDYR